MNRLFHQAAILIATAMLLVPIKPAQAFVLRGGAASASAPTGLITTLQLANNSSSVIPANSITPMFGQTGKDGDFPSACSGAAPIFKLHSDNTVLPFSESVQPICYADGSLQHAAFMARDPESIAVATNYTLPSSGHLYVNATGVITVTLPSVPTYGSYLGFVTLSGLTGTGSVASLDGTFPVISVVGAVLTIGGPVAVGTSTITGGTLTQPTYAQVDVYSGGTYPSPSSRTTADYTAGGTDLNQQVVGLDSQLSGTWETDLGQGITAHGTTKYMDGAAGRVDMVWADFQQSGSSHGQLEGRWYVAALQDSSGNFAGIRYLIRTTAPWYNVASPSPNFWSFSSISDYNGASLIKNPWSGQTTPVNFSWSSGSSYSTTGATWQPGMAIQLTTTGSLPTGLSTGTTYFVDNGGNPPYSTTSFNICQHSAPSVCVTATGAGSGTNTATAYPYITQFGSLFDAQSNGRWNYAQGNGSITVDQPIQVIPNVAYLRSTQLIPPYNFTFAQTYPIKEPATYPYSMMTMGPIYAYSETTSDRGDIGPFTQWASIYLFNQTPSDEENVRTIGLIGGQLPFNFRDATTHEIPCINNNCPSGMPTLSATSFVWDCSTPDSTGFTVPVTQAVWVASFGECNTSHMPAFDMAPFLLFGEPQYMELLEEQANEAEYQTPPAIGTASVGAITSITGGIGPSRNVKISGTTYYGTDLSTNNFVREAAWAWRNLAAGVFASQADPGCPQCYSYIHTMVQSTEAAAAAYINLFGSSYPWVTNNGVWDEEGPDSTSWAGSYLINAWALSAAWTQDGSGISNFLSYLMKWPAHVNNTFGASYTAYYAAEIRQSPASVSSPYITSDSLLTFEHLTLSWAANSSTFTIVAPLGDYVPANGDTVMWAGAISCPDNGNCAPAGVASNTLYYWCNISGSTGNLGTDTGCGTLITPTAASVSGVSASPNFYAASFVPPYSVGNNYINGHGYVSTALASFQFLTALGLSPDQTTLNDQQTEIIACNGPTSVCTNSNYPAGYQNDPTYLWQKCFSGSCLIEANDNGYDEGYVAANDNWHERMLLSGHP